MNCKHCNTELEEGVTLCPNCGTENAPSTEIEDAAPVTAPETQVAEPEAQEAPAENASAPEKTEGVKPTTGKLAITIGACVVLLALLIALIVGGTSYDASSGDADATTSPSTSEETVATEAPTVPEDGNPDDATCKGSYTASDDEVLAAADTVIATMDGAELTNAELQVYYALMVSQFLNTDNFYYLFYSGLFDYTQPLDTQMSAYAENMTWQQYFIEESLNAWQLYKSLALEAEQEGYELPAEYREYLDTLPTDIEEDAVSAGYESADAFIKDNLGSCATLENYLKFQEVYYLGYSYYQSKIDAIDPTDEEIENYFALHEAEYAENGLTKEYKLVDVRHILIMPDGADSSTIRTETFSDEAWATAEAKAQEIYDAWLAGDATEDSFAELAMEHSADGSSSDGGLITDIAEGEMVESFENWCFDATRQTGDHGIVKSEFGYHIMYFVRDDYKWAEYTRSDIITEQGNALIDSATEAHPMQVSYSDIKLGTLELA